jgi:hypothetical protein
MENNTQELHVQKMAILSRLIKESSLTLEEALTLLKEEEPKQTSVQFYNSSTGTAYIPPLGTWSSTGIPTFLSMSGSGSVSSITNTSADSSADLNN